MSKTYFCLGVLVFCLGSISAQKTFYGTINYTYEITGDQAADMAGYLPTNMILKYAKTGTIAWIRGGLMDAMLGRMVNNEKTKDCFVIQDPIKTVFVLTPEDIKNSAAAQVISKFERMAETKEIIGYTCNKYLITTTQDGKEAVQTMWVTNELRLPKPKSTPASSFMGSMGFGNISVPGIPLEIEQTMNAGGLVVTMTATKVQAGKIPETEFQRPKGYAVKTFKELQSQN